MARCEVCGCGAGAGQGAQVFDLRLMCGVCYGVGGRSKKKERENSLFFIESTKISSA